MLIALTGGIGSGKSTVAARWAELGATEIDADLLAREVVEPGSEGLEAVVQRFGSEILNQDGSLNRDRLAELVFASESSRKDLEAILHPRIQGLAQQRADSIPGTVVYTIPLFVESKSPLKFDHVVTVSCPESVRIARLVNNRGMSQEEAARRIASQAKDSEREAVADRVIDSNCSLEELVMRADKMFFELTSSHNV